MHVLIAGQGHMGRALADALLARGIAVTVWNRTVERCFAAVSAGASLAITMEDGAQSCDVMITCLSDGAAVRASLATLQTGRILRGKALVQLSQTTVEEAEGLAEWATANGVGYLDGSIMGLPSDIRGKGCMIVYSGQKTEFERQWPILSALGGNPRHVGEAAGAASAFDKAFFSAYYTHLAGFFHGAAICKAAGVPLETYFDLMITVWNWQGPDAAFADMIRTGDFTAKEATLDVHAYAFAQVSRLCRQKGIDARLPDAVAAAMADAIERGLGDQEIAALVETFQNSGR